MSALTNDAGPQELVADVERLLSEVETLAQRIIIIRRGHLGLAKKLSELETESVIVLEARGPSDQVLHALRAMNGVTQATCEGLGDGLNAYEVRTRRSEDLREQLFQVLARHDWPVRRLDLRLRKLQDRWNAINNTDDSLLQTATTAAPPTVGAGTANPAGPSAVT